MKKNKILLFSPNISQKTYHGQTFIRTRVNQYLKNGYKVDIITIGNKKIVKKNKNLKFIVFNNYNDVKKFLKININYYKFFFIHFITFKLIKIIKQFKNVNFTIWIHGIESQKWTWYTFDLFLKPYWFFKHIVYNFIQLYFLKNFIISNKKNLKIIFNSKWMKRVFMRDLGIKKIENKFKIIPNPVDEGFFRKFKRVKKKKLNVLILKNFTSYKYAGDITIDYILNLSNFKLFKHFNFTIIGKGKLLTNKIDYLKKLKNIKIINKFIDNKKLIKYHNKNDIFVYLTRMDAQSVTMSEGLASGLVVISSNNSAIPEFINHNKNGYLVNNFNQFYEILLNLNKNYSLVDKISKNTKKNSFYLKPNYVFKKEKEFLNL